MKISVKSFSLRLDREDNIMEIMKLLEPQEINESEFREFITEFRTANEKLVPYSIIQRDFNFQTFIKSLQDESQGI
ncbi:MAG: hypothetical protein Q7J16_04955, partial [Candidatus Cloacimonadales bacterium]|nr:hypothetical protein [Candidatus Cloacimonadales bacterium]